MSLRAEGPEACTRARYLSAMAAGLLVAALAAILFLPAMLVRFLASSVALSWEWTLASWRWIAAGVERDGVWRKEARRG